MFLQGNCLEQQSMLRLIEILGFIGGGLTVVMLAMRGRVTKLGGRLEYALLARH
jgi:hypothetical protein